MEHATLTGLIGTNYRVLNSMNLKNTILGEISQTYNVISFLRTSGYG